MTTPDSTDSFPFRFTCRRSGNCCSIPGGFVRVSADEAERIATHLGMGLPAFRSRYLAATGDRLAAGLDQRCVFLEDGAPAGCRIYPVRPHKCRTWPFWPEFRDDPARVVRICPGVEPIGMPGPQDLDV